MDTNKTQLSVRTLLTVPQAAKRLEITQRRLRALLARPEYAGRTRPITLSTRHGIRWTAPGIPLDLLADLDCAVNPVGVHPAECRATPSRRPPRPPTDRRPGHSPRSSTRNCWTRRTPGSPI